MSQFLQSGPSAYKQSWGESIIVIPGSGNLSKIKQAQGLNEGRYNSVYKEQIITRGKTMEIWEVMYDEMKQKEGMLYNVANSVSYVTSTLSYLRVAQAAVQATQIYGALTKRL